MPVVHLATEGTRVRCGLNHPAYATVTGEVTCRRCNPMAVKQCTGCLKVKPLESFYRRGKGRVSKCKACYPQYRRPTPTSKLCNGCKKHLPAEFFDEYTDRAGHTRRRARCSDCRKTGNDYDNDNHGFKGLGIKLCRNCGRPYRDHPRIEWCRG